MAKKTSQRGRRADKRYQKVRREFLSTASPHCHYCGIKTQQKKEKLNTWCTVDHVKPVVDYPQLKRDPSNFVVACRKCNSLKGQMTKTEFLNLYPELKERA